MKQNPRPSLFSKRPLKNSDGNIIIGLILSIAIAVGVGASFWDIYVRSTLMQVQSETQKLVLDEMKFTLVRAIENPDVILKSIQNWNANSGIVGVDLIGCLRVPGYVCTVPAGFENGFEFPLILDETPPQKFILNPRELANGKRLGITFGPDNCTDPGCDQLLSKAHICDQFVADGAPSSCAVRFVAKWIPLCPPGGEDCIRPQILLKISIEKSQNTNANLTWISEGRYDIQKMLL